MYTICALKMDPTFAIWSSTISFYLPILLEGFICTSKKNIDNHGMIPLKILCCTCILYQAGSNALKRLDLKTYLLLDFIYKFNLMTRMLHHLAV